MLEMNKILKNISLSLLCWITPILAYANGADNLKAYLKNISTLRADFHQTLSDEKGRKLQEVDGTMQLMRPNKFRWDYQKPYEQQIISDGQQVWLFDPELQQVTIRQLSKSLGSSPAALLASGKDIEKNFVIKEAQRKGNLEWALIIPKDKDSGYSRVLAGFNGDLLQEIWLYDTFGQVTQIVFSKLERNPKIEAKNFLFTAPNGVDQVSE